MTSEIPLIPPSDDVFPPPAAPSPDPDDLPRPGFWRRFLCWGADAALLAAAGVLVQHFVFGVEFPDVTIPESEAAATTNAEFIANVVLAFLYFGLMHGCFGASVGKMLGRCRVVTMNGERIGYGRSCARAFWSVGVLGVLECPRLLYPEGGFELLSDVGALYVLFDCLCLVWDQKYNRAFHDRLSGTRVVMKVKSLVAP